MFSRNHRTKNRPMESWTDLTPPASLRKGGGSETGELPELAHEMRLVGVTRLGGDPGPAEASPSKVPTNALESNQTCGHLRSHADLTFEPRDQMLVAPPRVGGQLANRSLTITLHQHRQSVADFRRRPGALINALQKERVDETKPFVPRREIANLFTEATTIRPEDVDEIHRLTRQLVERQTEDAVRAQRRQPHFEI